MRLIILEDNDDEGEDDTEAHTFSPSDRLAAWTLAHLAPFRPAASSSDADDSHKFLQAEVIQRQLNGDDDSSQDKINKFPAAPDDDTEDDDEFAACELDRNGAHRGYRARGAPSPELIQVSPYGRASRLPMLRGDVEASELLEGSYRDHSRRSSVATPKPWSSTRLIKAQVHLADPDAPFPKSSAALSTQRQGTTPSSYIPGTPRTSYS
jgi:hypothetical protein